MSNVNFIDRQIARGKELNRRMRDANVADNMDVREGLIRCMKAGKITFEEMQAELQAIQRNAKRDGKPTMYGS